jgi:hypothetical protein
MEQKKEMIDEVKLRELFDAKVLNSEPNEYPTTNALKEKFFHWFKFGFESAYPPLLTFKTPNPLTPEKEAEILRQLKDVRSCSTLIVEPDNKLIFVYSWRSAQQRTMIILADSRDEADSIFNDQFDDADLPKYYVTQLFVDGGESTIIYNN